MKKNLFFLFALICCTSLFTACSDDDEDMGWKEIPTEIPTENVKLDINGSTPENASASLKIESGETGILTLANAVYGHASIPVNVVLTKVEEGSYDFTGTANIDGTTKATAATDLGLTVHVKGNVTKAGKLTVNVTTSGWGTISGVYSGDSLKATFNGTEDNRFPVKVTAISDTKATLVFSKIPNIVNDFSIEVTIAKDGEGYKLSGTAEKEAGYNVNVTGTVIKNVLTVDVTTTGYATFTGSYSADKNEITYNGVKSENGSISLKVTSETAATITVNSMIPGSTVTIADGKASKAADSETYTISGSAKTAGYEISFEGTVTPDKKMTGAVKYKILSPIVGKWGPKMGMQGAESIFKFASKTGTVTFPKEVVEMLPADLKPYFAEKMPDAQLVQTVKGLLGQFVPYLQYIEFTEGGDVNIAYTEMGKTDVQVLAGYINYFVKDNQVYLVPNLGKLMGMMSMSSKTKAWDPSTLFEGIPFDFNAANGTLNIWINHEVISGLVPTLGAFMPIIGSMLPPEQAGMITTIFSTVNSIVSESTQFEAGLVMTKK